LRLVIKKGKTRSLPTSEESDSSDSSEKAGSPSQEVFRKKLVRCDTNPALERRMDWMTNRPSFIL